MTRYQVAIIERPEKWEPASPDDVPPQPAPARDALAESDELFAAVRQAIQHNQSPARAEDRRWAVVVEPGSRGQIWPEARLCTPLAYRVTAAWWPTGWEPGSPLDVPKCVWKAEGEGREPPMTYRRALATVRGLNRQSMDQAGTTWYVVVAVENEPVSQTVSFDASGTETTIVVRRLHVVRPEPGRGLGDCSHCPAHSMQCEEDRATEDRATVEKTVSHAGPGSLSSKS